jgi:hypothetical protein
MQPFYIRKVSAVRQITMPKEYLDALTDNWVYAPFKITLEGHRIIYELIPQNGTGKSRR